MPKYLRARSQVNAVQLVAAQCALSAIREAVLSRPAPRGLSDGLCRAAPATRLSVREPPSLLDAASARPLPRDIVQRRASSLHKDKAQQSGPATDLLEVTKSRYRGAK